jgi:hypothetical protein
MYETGRREPPLKMKEAIVRGLQSVKVKRRPWSESTPEELSALVQEDPRAFVDACIAISRAKKRRPQ